MAVVVAVDAGTTSVRSLVIDESGTQLDIAGRELTQHYPRPGWVEHDPSEIWSKVQATLAEVSGRVEEPIAAIGVTNQRETAVAWDRASGRPLQRALVWQDRRTAGRCDEVAAAGHLPMVRDRTGLVLDPYFTATKLEWLLGEGGVEIDASLACGTVDSWVVWNLTGGTEGGAFVTEPSNASRTLLYDIREGAWSAELCELFGVPAGSLPAVLPSSGRMGLTPAGVAGSLPSGTPVSGVAGDQQASLFGQACFGAGMTKNTYGTGSFVLMNVGPSCPEPVDGLLTTIAWDLGPGGLAYALEGAIFVTGAAVQWLRDGLGLITAADEIGPLAESVADTGGVYVVPAFTGLGSPWWDPYARGTVVGLSRGSGRAEIARAVVEAMAYQTRDVVETMTAGAGRSPTELRVDGGASVMGLLLQLQADQLRIPVRRAASAETTATGAAYLAGIAEGVWGSVEDVAALWASSGEAGPVGSASAADASYARWRDALARSRRWAG